MSSDSDSETNVVKYSSDSNYGSDCEPDVEVKPSSKSSRSDWKDKKKSENKKSNLLKSEKSSAVGCEPKKGKVRIHQQNSRDDSFDFRNEDDFRTRRSMRSTTSESRFDHQSGEKRRFARQKNDDQISNYFRGRRPGHLTDTDSMYSHQRSHNSLHYKYPSHFHRCGSAKSSSIMSLKILETLAGRLPASLCPASRYGNEPRLMHCGSKKCGSEKRNSRQSKQNSHHQQRCPHSTHPPRYRSVATDCEILKYAEKNEKNVQASAKTKSISCQKQVEVSDKSTQRPRERPTENCSQTEKQRNVDCSSQVKPKTRNRMTETCVKIIYGLPETGTQNSWTQCDEVPKLPRSSNISNIDSLSNNILTSLNLKEATPSEPQEHINQEVEWNPSLQQEFRQNHQLIASPQDFVLPVWSVPEGQEAGQNMWIAEDGGALNAGVLTYPYFENLYPYTNADQMHTTSLASNNLQNDFNHLISQQQPFNNYQQNENLQHPNNWISFHPSYNNFDDQLLKQQQHHTWPIHSQVPQQVMMQTIKQQQRQQQQWN